MAPPAAYRDRWVQVGEQPLHLLDWGDPTAPVATLVHGITENAHTWDDFAARLVTAHGLRVLALDLPGHGASPPPGPAPSLESFARAVVGAIAATTQDGALQLLAGHSLGGRVAALLAGQGALRPAGLVLEDMPPAQTPTIERLVRDYVAAFAPEFPGLDAFMAVLRRPTPFARRGQLLRRALFSRDPLPGGRVRPRFSLEATDQLGADVAPWLEAIRCPTLVVRGEASKLFPRQTAEAVAAAIPQGRLVTVLRAAHVPHADNAEDFYGVVADFLRTLDASQAPAG